MDPGFWFFMAPAIAAGAVTLCLFCWWIWLELTELWERWKK